MVLALKATYHLRPCSARIHGGRSYQVQLYIGYLVCKISSTSKPVRGCTIPAHHPCLRLHLHPTHNRHLLHLVAVSWPRDTDTFYSVISPNYKLTACEKMRLLKKQDILRKLARGLPVACVASNQTFVSNKTFISWMLINSDK